MSRDDSDAALRGRRAKPLLVKSPASFGAQWCTHSGYAHKCKEAITSGLPTDIQNRASFSTSIPLAACPKIGS